MSDEDIWGLWPDLTADPTRGEAERCPNCDGLPDAPLYRTNHGTAPPSECDDPFHSTPTPDTAQKDEPMTTCTHQRMEPFEAKIGYAHPTTWYRCLDCGHEFSEPHPTLTLGDPIEVNLSTGPIQGWGCPRCAYVQLLDRQENPKCQSCGFHEGSRLVEGSWVFLAELVPPNFRPLLSDQEAGIVTRRASDLVKIAALEAKLDDCQAALTEARDTIALWTDRLGDIRTIAECIQMVTKLTEVEGDQAADAAHDLAGRLLAVYDGK